MRGRRTGAVVLLALAALAAVVALLLPLHPETGLLRALARVLPPGAIADGGPAWWALEDAGNVALFVPVGAVLAAVLGVRRGALVAVALSAACELAQVWIPVRHASLRDVLMNSIGALLGAGIVALVVRRRTRRSQTSRRWPQVAQRQ